MALDSDILSQKMHSKAAVHLYDSIDSTNNEAKRRAQTDRGVCLYVTTHQTAGRGRRGHGFYSPKDTGLYMTLAFPADNADIQRLTCAAGVAVCEAVGSLTDRTPQIKWVSGAGKCSLCRKPPPSSSPTTVTDLYPLSSASG